MPSIKLQSYIAGQWSKAFVLRNGVFLLLAAFLAVGLKHHYSQAGSEDLAWILRPTAWLVARISGIPFVHETHTGFVNYPRQIVIAPACAGVNFLIVAFCMAAFSGLRRIQDRRVKWLWLIGAMLGAYGLTIFVNALRIILSIHSYDAGIHFGRLTPERVHRLEGVIIYFFFLCLFYRIIAAILPLIERVERPNEREQLTAGSPRRELAALIPFFWYGLVTLAIPLLNGAMRRDEVRFAEHATMIVLGCLGVLAVVFLIRSGWKRLRICKVN